MKKLLLVSLLFFRTHAMESDNRHHHAHHRDHIIVALTNTPLKPDTDLERQNAVACCCPEKVKLAIVAAIASVASAGLTAALTLTLGKCH